MGEKGNEVCNLRVYGNWLIKTSRTSLYEWEWTEGKASVGWDGSGLGNTLSPGSHGFPGLRLLAVDQTAFTSGRYTFKPKPEGVDSFNGISSIASGMAGSSRWVTALGLVLLAFPGPSVPCSFLHFSPHLPDIRTFRVNFTLHTVVLSKLIP